MNNTMKNKLNFIFLFVIFWGVVGCQKDEIKPVEYISLGIDKSGKKILTGKASISKGITVIAAHELEKNKKSNLVINVHGDRKGSYKQEYDYKTNVSVTQCALTYKIISKSENNKTKYFASYEGVVNILEIDRENNKISGSYNFKAKDISKAKNIKDINGKFINLSYE